MKAPRQGWSRLITAALLVAAAVAFAGPACERNDAVTPDAPPAETGIRAAASSPRGEEASDEADPAGDVDKEKVFEAKVPQDVGPKAPALFMLTGLKGYTEPCGCTLDVMLGGIDRIVRYVDDARDLYPASGLIDGGDLLFEHAELEPHVLPQERARVKVIVAGLKRLAPELTVPGERDFALGHAFYTETLAEAGVEPVAANLRIDDEALRASKVVSLGEERVGVIGVVQPELFEEIDGVEASAPGPAVERALAELKGQGIATIVLAAHGDLAFGKKIAAAHPAIDFVLVGHEPRETDQVDQAGSAHTLEPYSQGRYLGILKLYPADSDSPSAPFVNARSGSKAELETITRQIEHVGQSIEKLPPAGPGEEPPILLNLRKRLQDLEERRRQMKAGAIEVPEAKNAFVWRSVPMEPGYGVDPRIEQVRQGYNKSLEVLHSQVEREVVPPAEGEPFYIGSNQCASCHTAAHEFWQKTAHADALATLQERDKAFDHTCIGCHVVGYDKPGGSVLGKLEYDAELHLSAGSEPLKITKDLRNVGCENCHGPGSAHRIAPVGADGKPQHIEKGSGEGVCGQCHVPDHSPRFDYDVYVRQITGEGHGKPAR